MAGIDYVAPWFRLPYPGFDFESRTTQHEIWKTLTPNGQALCSLVVATEGEEVPGAGMMHPDPQELARLRQLETARILRAASPRTRARI